MRKENLYQPFEIILEEADECPIRNQAYNFFQLVYIASGTGTHRVNNNIMEYNSGKLFLLTPDDYHSFDIETTTKFLLIRFNNIYIQNNSFEKSTIQRIEFIIQNANHLPGCILYKESDKRLTKAITESIISEYESHDLYNKELVLQLINTLIIIAARNIVESLPEKVDERTEKKTLEILQYIQHNIYQPEQIRVKVMSEKFNVSVTYLGRYFKKHTNETMQQYITNYRMKLIENRLLHSDMRVKEIALEFGFSDESHFVKFFKKQQGMNPSAYRMSAINKE